MATLRNHSELYQRLVAWHDEGRHMPGYCKGYGGCYILYLLGVYSGPLGRGYDQKIDYPKMIDEHNPHLVAQLNGPHGWAVLKVLMIRKGGNACAGSESTTTASCP